MQFILLISATFLLLNQVLSASQSSAWEGSHLHPMRSRASTSSGHATSSTLYQVDPDMRERMDGDSLLHEDDYLEEYDLPKVEISAARFADKMQYYARLRNVDQYQKYKDLLKLFTNGSSRQMYSKAEDYHQEQQTALVEVAKLQRQLDRVYIQEEVYRCLAEARGNCERVSEDAIKESLIGCSYSRQLQKHIRYTNPEIFKDVDIANELEAYLEKQRSDEEDLGSNVGGPFVGQTSATDQGEDKMRVEECLLRQRQHEAAALTNSSPHYSI